MKHVHFNKSPDIQFNRQKLEYIEDKFLKAAESGNFGVINYYYNRVSDEAKEDALWIAVRHYDLRIIKILLKRNVKVTSNTIFSALFTREDIIKEIMEAVVKDDIDSAKDILEFIKTHRLLVNEKILNVIKNYLN